MCVVDTISICCPLSGYNHGKEAWNVWSIPHSHGLLTSMHPCCSFDSLPHPYHTTSPFIVDIFKRKNAVTEYMLIHEHAVCIITFKCTNPALYMCRFCTNLWNQPVSRDPGPYQQFLGGLVSPSDWSHCTGEKNGNQNNVKEIHSKSVVSDWTKRP